MNRSAALPRPERVQRLLGRRELFWLLLALPAVPTLLSSGIAMDKVAAPGEWSARFLILAMSLSPLMLLTRGAAWVRWLLARRRYIGVAAFVYAALHLFYYALDIGSADAVLAEALIRSIAAGWLAFFALLAMAATSNDAAMRLMKRGWKRLQRLAYPAALLTLIHWLMVHDGVTEALLHFAPLAFLEIYRLIHQHHRRTLTHA